MAAAKQTPAKGETKDDGPKGEQPKPGGGDTTPATLADDRAKQAESRAVEHEQARQRAEGDRDAALEKLKTAQASIRRLEHENSALRRQLDQQKAENRPDLSKGSCQLGESVTVISVASGAAISARPGDVLVGVEASYKEDARTGKVLVVPGLTAKDQKMVDAVEKKLGGLYRCIPVDVETVQEVEARGLTRG